MIDETKRQLAEWKADRAALHELKRLPVFGVYQKHLQRMHEAALANLMALDPTQTDGMIHWRAIYKATRDAIDLPDLIITEADRQEAYAEEVERRSSVSARR